MESCDIDEFYSKYAHLYEKISMDRAFDEQVDSLLRYSGKEERGSALELFAGPAYHGMELKKRRWECLSVDNSHEMCALAIENGISPEDYFVSDIPGCFSNMKRNGFDVIFCLRYSIGYLNKKKVLELFEGLSNFASGQSFMFIELHNLPSLMNSLNDLSIRERVFNIDPETSVRCTWPYGDIKWDRHDFNANMSVFLEWIRNGETIKEQLFHTKEYIHSMDSIVEMSEAYGWSAHVISDDVLPYFQGSEMLMLSNNSLQ